MRGIWVKVYLLSVVSYASSKYSRSNFCQQSSMLGAADVKLSKTEPLATRAHSLALLCRGGG